MRILVVSNFYPPEFFGGYELGCCEIVNGLRRNNHDVIVCTTPSHLGFVNQPKTLRYLELADIYRPVVMRSDCQSLADIKARLINYHNISVLLDIAAHFQPDVVYLWNLLGLGVAGIVSVLNHVGLPWVWHLMDRVPAAVSELRNPGLEILMDSDGGLFTRGTIVAVSNTLIEECKSFGVNLGDQIVFLPTWTSRTGDLAARSQRGKTLRCLYVGTLGEHKGTGFILEAARLLIRQQYRDFSIDLHGLGDCDSYRSKALQNNIDAFVRVHGPASQEEVYPLYLEHDVFLFPTSPREPNAFAVYEAASAGCVPLISRICGNAEWLVDNVHVIKIDRSAEGLAQALGAVLDGQIDLEGLRRRGSWAARTSFTLSSVLGKIQELLERSARPFVYDDSRWQSAKITYNLLEKVAIQQGFHAASEA